jgi:diacylglycerol kinase family enzyme
MAKGNPDKHRVLDRLKNADEHSLMVVNPMSKKGAEKASNVRRMARREGVDLEETSTDHPDDIGSTIEFWSKRFGGSRVILVVGGDGAINQVINNIMLSKSNKNVVLAPVPAGTANDFCRSMKLTSIEASLEALADFKVRTIDIIKIDITSTKDQVRYCSNIIGVGLDADLARRSQKYKKWGVPGYWYASLKHAAVLLFKGIPEYNVRLKAVGLEYEGPCIGLMIANINQYARTFKIAPGAQPDDGKLYVTIAKPMMMPKAFLAAMSIQFGMHDRFKQVSTFTCEEVELEIMDDLYSQEDGEVFFFPRGTKLHITLERQALNVTTPTGVSEKA